MTLRLAPSLFQVIHMIRSLPLAVLTPRHLTVSPRPDEICRQAQKHNPEADRAVQRKFINQTKRDDTTGRNKEKGSERMSGNTKNISTARTISFSKYEDAHSG